MILAVVAVLLLVEADVTVSTPSFSSERYSPFVVSLQPAVVASTAVAETRTMRLVGVDLGATDLASVFGHAASSFVVGENSP